MGTHAYRKFPYTPPDDLRAGGVPCRPLIVVGAGPVGLAAAIDARVHGIPVLVFDEDQAVSIGSRAVCYAKRALELGADIRWRYKVVSVQPADDHVLLRVETPDGIFDIEVLGTTDHTLFQSIYFRDPSGHRLELAVNTGTPEMYRKLDEVKHEMIEEWSKTKRAPRHAAWMHEKEFA